MCDSVTLSFTSTNNFLGGSFHETQNKKSRKVDRGKWFLNKKDLSLELLTGVRKSNTSSHHILSAKTIGLHQKCIYNFFVHFFRIREKIM